MQNTLSTPATQQVKASVNERMFFKSMQHLFNSSFSVVSELLQNARRAGATKINVDLDPEKRILTVADNGKGIDDFGVLLDLATSGWDSEEVMLSDKPFGMGFFSTFYACEHVVVRSRGLFISASKEDIIERRNIGVLKDTRANTDTVVELHGLTENVLGKKSTPLAQTVETFELRIKRLALGFEIPIYFNGVRLSNAHASSKLVGEHTEAGLISVAGIHREGLLPQSTISPILYLQGLPIEDAYPYDRYDKVAEMMELPPVVIHLDSSTFVAKMPDRSHLYDSEMQRKRIKDAQNGVFKQFLLRQKAELPASDFAQRHWEMARALNMAYVFNDVPFVPLHLFDHCETVAISTEYTGTMTGHAKDEGLVTYDEVKSGAVKVWRDTPSCVTDDPWAAVAMKVMQRQRIMRVLTSEIHTDHWLHTLTPHFEDLVFNVEVEQPEPDKESFCWQNSTAEMRAAKSAIVTITSSVDDSYRLQVAFTDDWLLEPLPEQEDVFDNFDYKCWLLGEDGQSDDHPVNALATFDDEFDSYREEWESEARRDWADRLTALRKQHLSCTVARQLDAYGHIGAQQVGQMVLVKTTGTHLAHLQNSDTDPVYRYRLFAQPIDDQLAKKVCEALINKAPGLTPEMVMEAMREAFKPGVHLDGPLKDTLA